jgi:FixJ family two-component response regulator
MTDSPVVIVVDDDDSLRDAMRRLLDAGGFSPVAYASGEAPTACGRRRPVSSPT